MDYKQEIILFVVQILILVFFSFLLKDILAALLVSFLSRPLIKIAVKWFNQNLEKRQKRGRMD